MIRIRKSTQGGFTLAELLVAFAIFILGAVPIVGLMTAATYSHTKSTHQVRASLLCRLIMDEIQSRGQTDSYTDMIDQTHPDYPDYQFDVLFVPLSRNRDAVVYDVIVYMKGNKTRELNRLQGIARKKVVTPPAP